MALIEEMEKQGNFLFKYRGILPLIVLVLGVIVLYLSKLNKVEVQYHYLHDFIYLFICLLGLSIRILVVGFTPKGTSGRNVKKQVANILNTSGIYSIVRHPLYLGNFLIWLGIVLFIENIWLVVLFVFVFWVYYERIMFAEEQFLRKKFGDQYLQWAEKTPAFIPNFKLWKSPELTFSYKKILKKEKNGFTAIFLLILLFKVVGEYAMTGSFIPKEKHWIVLAGFSFLLYIILRYMKKKTKLLNEKGR